MAVISNMAWRRTRATFSVFFQALALCICIVVGAILLLESNILASAQDVVEGVRLDPRLHSSDLHHLDEEVHSSLRHSKLKLRVVGSILLAVSLVVLCGIVEVIVKMCRR